MTRLPRWPLLVLAMPAFVAIWSGWVGLGTLTGFGLIHPLPGTPLDGWQLDTRITLPIGVETYAAYALWVWLGSREAPDVAREFAKWSAIGSLVLGAAGQVAYHLMSAAKVTQAPWWITTLVSSLPVAVVGMGAALAHLSSHDAPSEQATSFAIARHAPTQLAAEEKPRTSPAPAVTAGKSTGSPDASPAPAPPGAGTSGPSGGGLRAGKPAASSSPLDDARDIADRLQQRGLAVNYKNVAPALRERGHAAGRAKVDGLIAEISKPQLHAVGAP